MARTSAEKVANKVCLAADELLKPCDSDIISSLANCFCHWKVIFGSLLSELDLNDVNKENLTEEEKRIAALRKWKARNGIEATYKILVDALLNKGERYQAESLCKILADHLSHNKTETTATDSDAKENEADIRFQCPCGECLLETYLKDGCPKSCIPYLGMTTLSKGDQENLNYILKKDTKKIMESFTNLSNRTCDSLIRQEVTVDRLIRVAVTSNSSLHDKLTGSTSIDQVFTHLAPEMSFFNHKTLAKIIEELGHPDDKDRLADYSKEFKEFCKRKIFEIEPGHCTCGQRFSQVKRRKLFAVVLPAGEKTLQNLGDAVSIKEMLADDLDIPLDTLHLHRIDRGSIILVFSVPDSIAYNLFPLPKEKLALLRVKGMVLFIPQDMKSQTSQVKDNVTKPLAHSADMHESSSKYTPTVPSGTPRDLLISHSLPTSAQLSWTPAPEDKQNDTITGYTIQIEGPNFMREIPVMDENAASYEIADLRPYTTYTFSVSAMTEAGIGPAICVSSTTPEGVPSKPGELHVHHGTPTSAQLSWTAVPKNQQNGIITGYTVQVAGPDSLQEISITDATVTSTEVSGLRPNTSYYFSVSAMTVAGTGPPARSLSITPQRVPSGSPEWLAVRCSHPTSVRVSWGPVPKEEQIGVITGYKIQVEGPNYNTSRNILATTTVSDWMPPIHRLHSLTEGGRNSEEVSGLRPSTEYSFSVSAVTVAGSGPAISLSFIMPQEALSNTIGRFKTSQYHLTLVWISWEAVQGDVTGYRVCVEGPDSTQVIPINENVTSVVISHLRPCTQYTFKVSAMIIAGTKPRRGILSELSAPYSWKSFFAATSGKNTAQYRMMLEYTPSLEDALADDTNVTWLTTELEKAGLIMEDQRKSLETSIDTDTRAAKLIRMVTTEVRCNSASFITFLDVIKKDDATYGHILAKMKEKVSCGTPGELFVSHSLPTSAQLSWTPVPEDKQNDTITGYTIQIEGPNLMREIPVMDENATSYEVSDLRPYTTYTFGVSAITKAGVGPPIIVSSTTPQGGLFNHPPLGLQRFSSYPNLSMKQDFYSQALIKRKVQQSPAGLVSDPPLRLSRLSSYPGPSLKLSSEYLFKYKGEQNIAENVVGDLDEFIDVISKHIGLEWKFLARSLGFEQTDIDAIEYRDQHNLRDQIFQMFHEWKKREGNKATTDCLLAAIKEAELKELMKTLKEKGFILSSLRGSTDIASSGVQYPVQVTDDSQRDSFAKLKTIAKSPTAPAPPPGAQGQGQGGATPPSEQYRIRQKRLQQFASDTPDTNPTQGTVMEQVPLYFSGSVQSPVLPSSAAVTGFTADIPAALPGFEVGDMIQVDRRDSAPWYGVVRWIGTPPGGSSLTAGLEMEDKVPGGGPGSLLGINYFSCSDGHGLFLPLNCLKRDNRFAEVDSEAPLITSLDQDCESSQPGRSVSAPEDRLRDLFSGFGMQDDAGAKQSDSEPKAFELQIPVDRAGLVIGSGGKNIREVERLTNTIINIDRGSGLLGGGNRRVTVVGNEENCKKALLIILKNIKRRIDEHTAGVKTISVPNSCVGRIIGKGRATISIIKSISGAQDIKFDDRKTGLEAMLQTERKCYIHGSDEAMEKAEKLIRLAMTGEDIVAGATFAAIFMELLKMGVQCQEERS